MPAQTVALTTTGVDPKDGALVTWRSEINAAFAALAELANTGSADDVADSVSKVMMLAAERTKLTGIEAEADKTDLTNVAAALLTALSAGSVNDASADTVIMVINGALRQLGVDDFANDLSTQLGLAALALKSTVGTSDMDILSVTTAILAENGVTFAKMQQLNEARLMGRASGAGTGNVDALTAADVRTMINVESGATANDTDANLLARANHTGTQAISTVTGLQDALDAKATTTQGLLADLLAKYAYLQDTRGELKEAFSQVLTGSNRAVIDIGTVSNNGSIGSVLRLDGADATGGVINIAPRHDIAIEQDRVYEVRVEFDRFADPVDPSGHSVELRMQNLSSTRASVSNVSLNDFGSVEIADGVQRLTMTFSRDVAGVDYTVPATTRYGLPYLAIYGDAHNTDVAVIDIEDVTDAFNNSATVSALTDRITQLEVVTIEDLAVDPSANQELGTSVAPDLSWTFGGTATPAELRINGALQPDPEVTSYTAPAPITATTSYTVRVDDGLGRQDSDTVTVTFLPRVFWGARALSSLDSANVIGLGGSSLSANKTLSKTITAASQYVYVAYPASFGLPSSYKIFGFTEVPVVTTVNVTTAAGHTADYYVLRSPNQLTGDIPVEVS